MTEMTSLVIVTATVAAFLVGLSKGGLASVGMLAVPLMALVMSPVTAAALLLPIYVISDMVGLYLYRGDFSGRNLAILMPAAVFGVCLGWAFSAHLPSLFIGMLVGLVGLLGCFNAWVGARFRKTVRRADVPAGLFWGTLAGLTSFVSHSGAPPFQIYVLPQRLDKVTFAGTSTILFAAINAAKIAPYWELRLFSRFDANVALWLLPSAIAGTFAGAKLTRVIPEKLFYLVIQIALLVLSLKLIADYVVTLFPT